MRFFILLESAWTITHNSEQASLGQSQFLASCAHHWWFQSWPLPGVDFINFLHLIRALRPTFAPVKTFSKVGRKAQIGRKTVSEIDHWWGPRTVLIVKIVIQIKPHIPDHSTLKYRFPLNRSLSFGGIYSPTIFLAWQPSCQSYCRALFSQLK